MAAALICLLDADLYVGEVFGTALAIQSYTIFLAMGVKDEGAYILGDDFARLPLVLDQLLEEGHGHEAVLGQIHRLVLGFLRRVHHVLEEVRQLLNVLPVVRRVELLEDRQEAYYEVRTVYLKVCLLILSHDAAKCRVVPHHIEHG